VRADSEFFEYGHTLGILNRRLKGDEILRQKSFELGVFEELLTEQFAGPSGV